MKSKIAKKVNGIAIDFLCNQSKQILFKKIRFSNNGTEEEIKHPQGLKRNETTGFEFVEKCGDDEN